MPVLVRLVLVVVLLLATWSTGATQAQIASNPIPTPIVKRGLAVEVKDLVRLPDTRGMRPADQDVVPSGWARVSYVRDLPDGRRFVNDSRGLLYVLGAGGEPRIYANVAAAFPSAVYNRLESGFISFVFHPEFARNGLFYTVHAERAAGNRKTPDFIPPGFTPEDVTYHNVITEWHAATPSAATFEGTRRELLREAHVVANLTHPLGAVEFNPTATPGSADYGLLYTSGSDHGFSNGGGPNASTASQTQRLDSIMTAILRFDPRSPSVTGGTKGLGDYTIPMANRFAADGDPKTLGEIYAYGFRNAHRLSWDTDGTMFASDIGMSNVEEINIVRNGGNYGWMRREGYWENGRWRGGALNELFALPPDVLSGRETDGFTYPVAIYDHDEGRAVTGGFAYHGRIAALQGKFVFGDIQNGRVFAADLAEMKKADDAIPQTVAPLEEIQLYVRDAGGNRMGVSMRELVDRTMGGSISRVDLHIARTADGELLLTSRQDGVIRQLIPDSAVQSTALQGQQARQWPTVANREVRPPSVWEETIAKFEAADRTSPPPPNGVVFVGASSIVRWNLAEYLPELGARAINRGFGGSLAADSTYYAERIVIPYKPRIVVFYAGDNDVETPTTPQQIADAFAGFEQRVHKALPDTKIVFISIKPSLRRFAFMDKITRANALVKNYIGTHRNLVYMDIVPQMLNAEGKPRPELLVDDGLHMTAEGYKVWTAALKPLLASLTSSTNQ